MSAITSDREARRVPTLAAWFVLLPLAVCPQPASAQETERLWPSLDPAKLPTVYVRDNSGAETAGKLLSIDPTSLVILVGDTERRFDVVDVRRIDRRGDSLQNGARIGALVGILLGAFSTGASDCPGGCPGTRVAMFLTSVGFWTSVGTAVDAAIPGRSTLYVAPDLSSKATTERAAIGPGISFTIRW